MWLPGCGPRARGEQPLRGACGSRGQLEKHAGRLESGSAPWAVIRWVLLPWASGASWGGVLGAVGCLDAVVLERGEYWGPG